MNTEEAGTENTVETETTEDDGSNDDAEEDFLANLDTSIDDKDETEDELIDEAEPVKEKIYYANWMLGYDNPRCDFKEFKSAVEAYKFLKKKIRRYKNTTYWNHVIEVWDGEKSEYIYKSVMDDEKTTDPEIQALIDAANAEMARNIAIGEINNCIAYWSCECAVTPEAFEVAVQAEIDNAVAEEDLISALDKYLDEPADIAAEEYVEEIAEKVVEYKPKLADKPYTCVTVCRFSEFTTSSFNPEKFFYTLNDAVKYALEDKHKRMDCDERYGGAVVYLDYENGMHRPIWEITAEGKFEIVDATENYGELDNDSVKAELAELNEGALAALAAEVEIKATLEKLAKLKATYPQIYSKVTADSAENVLTFKTKTFRKAKRIAS